MPVKNPRGRSWRVFMTHPEKLRELIFLLHLFKK